MVGVWQRDVWVPCSGPRPLLGHFLLGQQPHPEAPLGQRCAFCFSCASTTNSSLSPLSATTTTTRHSNFKTSSRSSRTRQNVDRRADVSSSSHSSHKSRRFCGSLPLHYPAILSRRKLPRHFGPTKTDIATASLLSSLMAFRCAILEPQSLYIFHANTSTAWPRWPHHLPLRVPRVRHQLGTQPRPCPTACSRDADTTTQLQAGCPEARHPRQGSPRAALFVLPVLRPVVMTGCPPSAAR